MSDWQPGHYLKFRSERTQPSLDLVARIDIDWTPADIIDVGCGPGNSTRILRQRWPEAHILGIDSSPSMISRAEAEYPAGDWQVVDIQDFASSRKYDVIYSNAVIQWIPDHDRLLRKLAGLLKERGVLAVQVPRFNDMPLGAAIDSVSRREKWDSVTGCCRDLFTYHDFGFYYDLLSVLFDRVEMWETSYLHEMESQEAVIDWIKSTGMKPFLDAIPDDRGKEQFSREVLEIVRLKYPLQKNGKVIFPFKRLFFIGYKG